MAEPDMEGWAEYRKLILAALERLEKSVKDVSDKVAAMEVDLATIKTKMVFIGGGVGIAVTVVTQIVLHLIQK